MAIDWMTIDKAKGNGDITLGVSANANAATSSRNARIKITSTDGSIVKYVSVIQEGKEADYLNVRPSSLGFPKEGGTETVTIETNGFWTLTKPDWVTISSSTGSGNATLTVSVGDNATGADLEGEIIVRVGTITKVIKVVQETVRLTVSPSTVVSPYEGLTLYSLEVTSNCSFTVSTENDWITLHSDSGNGNTYINFDTSKWDGEENRNGEIDFIVDGKSIFIVYVIQTPKLNKYEDYYIVTDGRNPASIEITVDGVKYTSTDDNPIYINIRSSSNPLYAIPRINFNYGKMTHFRFSKEIGGKKNTVNGIRKVYYIYDKDLTDLSYSFCTYGDGSYGSQQLSAEVNYFDTSKVTNMDWMWNGFFNGMQYWLNTSNVKTIASGIPTFENIPDSITPEMDFTNVEYAMENGFNKSVSGFKNLKTEISLSSNLSVKSMENIIDKAVNLKSLGKGYKAIGCEVKVGEEYAQIANNKGWDVYGYPISESYLTVSKNDVNLEWMNEKYYYGSENSLNWRAYEYFSFSTNEKPTITVENIDGPALTGAYNDWIGYEELVNTYNAYGIKIYAERNDSISNRNGKIIITTPSGLSETILVHQGFSTSKAQLQLDGGGQTGNVTIENSGIGVNVYVLTNGTPTATSSNPLIKVSDMITHTDLSGTKKYFTISGNLNTGDSIKSTVNITLYDKVITLNVTQRGGFNGFKINPSSSDRIVNEGVDGLSFNVMSVTSWTATTTDDWITITNGSGNGGTTEECIFNVAENNTGSLRAADINVSNGSSTLTFTVFQKGS